MREDYVRQVRLRERWTPNRRPRPWGISRESETFANRSELSDRVRQCRYVRRGPGRDFLDPTQPRDEWEDAMAPA
jgi:hypothetical protein